MNKKNLFKILEKNIKKYTDKKIILGLSGGLDSMALFYIFLEMKLNFLAIHVNHNFRKNSDLDQNFVSKICEKEKIKLISVKIKKENQPSEEFFRKERHKIFEKIKKKENADFVALAHTKDDFIESIFMYFLRGIGNFDFYSRYKSYDGKFLRPFFNIEKNDLLQFIESNNIFFREDETNKNCDYTRNFIRNKIFTKIAKKFPKYKDAILRNTILSSENYDFVKNSFLLQDVFIDDDFSDFVILNLQKYWKLAKAQKNICAKRIFEKFAIKKEKQILDYNKILQILDFFKNGNCGNVFFHFGLKMEMGKNNFVFIYKKEKIKTLEKKELKQAKNIFGIFKIFVKKTQFQKNTISKSLTQNKLFLKKQKIFMRTKKSGEYFYPLYFMHKKEVKKTLSEKSFISFEKQLVPVFVDKNDKIIAVYNKPDKSQKLNENEKCFEIIFEKIY